MNTSSDSEALMRSIDGTKTITVEEFDRLFDEGSDEIDDFIDWSSARRASDIQEHFEVNLPFYVALCLDREAAKLGVTKEALVENWVTEKLEERKTK